MENNLPLHFQEVIFGSSDASISKQISKLEKTGIIRKIAPRIYSSNFTDEPSEIIRRNLFTVLGKLYPGAVLSHRSALELKPTESGHIFLNYTYTKKIRLSDITIQFLEGPGYIEGDILLPGNIYASQKERAILENLQSSRKPGSESKTLALPEIEERLETIIRVHGVDEINKFRDKAREIAMQLVLITEFNRLNQIISALLVTHPSKILSSPVALARAFGAPFDPARIKLFEKLFIVLHKSECPYIPEKNTAIKAFRNFAFFESYFSNYIEGTVFELSEAKKIIETQQPLPARHNDSHDILGTYQIVSNQTEMSIVPKSGEELLDILRLRHRILLSSRDDKYPGMFKEQNNRAGETHFVDFSLVNGTLLKSFEFYQALKHPFAKAAFIMFVISEVHPFLDGNGRIARVMLNAELVKEGQSKIIIPTVYRDDYMGALRKLTRQSDPDPYLRMLVRIHQFSSTIYSDDINEMQQLLETSNAFLEHNEGRLKILTRS